MASIIAGLMSLTKFDQTSYEQLPDGRVRYEYLTSGLPIESLAKAKSMFLATTTLPLKRMKIIAIHKIEQGAVFARYHIIVESIAETSSGARF